MTSLINAYSTLIDPPPLDFPHVLMNRRDRSDPELVPHLDGFIGYVLSRGEKQMTRNKYHIMRHLQRVQHQVALELEQDAVPAFIDWARAANALTFLPDGAVRDPALKVLLDHEGAEPDAAARIPYPPDAEARKERSMALLAELGIQVPASLPPVIAEAEAVLRDTDEVALRALALMIVAVRGECWNAGDAFPAETLQRHLSWGFDALSPKETAFLADTAPTQQDKVNFTWRYEALFLLQWAVGWQVDLPEPSAICDVAATVGTIREAGQNSFVQEADLLPTDEILDALDFHYRLHWAVRQARLDKKEVPAGIEPGVVAERHYALNWLIRFEEAEWDEVDTPT
jgi:hypothetical protein